MLERGGQRRGVAAAIGAHQGLLTAFAEGKDIHKATAAEGELGVPVRRRETLAEPWAPERVAAFPATRYGPAGSGTIPRDTATAIARQLMAAEHPIVVTSYLGRKAEVREEADGSRLVIGAGSCLVAPGTGVLDLHAQAPDAEMLGVVQDVIGRHLVRFGEKDELVVDWS